MALPALAVLFAVLQLGQAEELTASDKLYKLITKENKHLDPGWGKGMRVGVTIICANLDEHTNVLTTRLVEHYAWVDYKRTWNPADYDGITKASAWPSEVWYPDLRLMNAHADAEVRDMVRVKFRPNGTVFWLPLTTYKTLCVPNEGTTPKSWHCRFGLSSWTYDGHHMPLEEFYHWGGVDTTMVYLDECPYVMKRAKSAINRVKYTCCPRPYDYLDVNFDLERRSDQHDDDHVEHHDDDPHAEQHGTHQAAFKKGCKWPHCKK